jgi:hypothetical protein
LPASFATAARSAARRFTPCADLDHIEILVTDRMPDDGRRRFEAPGVGALGTRKPPCDGP